MFYRVTLHWFNYLSNCRCEALSHIFSDSTESDAVRWCVSCTDIAVWWTWCTCWFQLSGICFSCKRCFSCLPTPAGFILQCLPAPGPGFELPTCFVFQPGTCVSKSVCASFYSPFSTGGYVVNMFLNLYVFSILPFVLQRLVRPITAGYWLIILLFLTLFTFFLDRVTPGPVHNFVSCFN
jgi:hypothetical protein